MHRQLVGGNALLIGNLLIEAAQPPGDFLLLLCVAVDDQLIAGVGPSDVAKEMLSSMAIGTSSVPKIQRRPSGRMSSTLRSSIPSSVTSGWM